MNGFVDNAWYAIALREEVGEELVSRRIAGVSVVLYRTSEGHAVALRDRCPHRGYPLSESKRVGDSIECGYHGFVFECSGRCVVVPGQSKIPSRADVASYPIVEAGPFVWIWMGAAELADETPLPLGDLAFGHDDWAFTAGRVEIGCHYELLVDNLLDLTHENWIHPTTIGAAALSESPLEVSVDEDERRVEAVRHMAGVEAPPAYAPYADAAGNIDRTQRIQFFAPSIYILDVRISEPGSDVAGLTAKVTYLLTPRDEGSTDYYYCIGRTTRLDDPAADDEAHARQAALIAEDAAAVELLQERIESEGQIDEVSVKIDTGGLAARRMIRLQIEQESSSETLVSA